MLSKKQLNNLLKDKIVLITGGTGSFGNAVMNKLLSHDVKEVRIFSRDEKKQDDMRKKFRNDKIKFFIGDVRDVKSLKAAIKGVNYLFHSAALKQVPSCEFYPLEAVRTNIIGTENVLDAAIENKVNKVICLSTDKAVYPINAMGISKAMMEKVMIAKSRNLSDDETIICGTRYGNVMASRGSVIPLFLRQILSGKEITVTDPQMTRFMMTLDEAVELVLHAFLNGKNGDIYVQKSPAATIEVLIEALKSITNMPNHPVSIIGTRHGEKVFETLCSREEMFVAEEQDNYFRVPCDNRDLNYKTFNEIGEKDLSNVNDYNSHNTHRLSIEEMIGLLKKLDFISDKSSGNLEIPDGV